MNEHWARQVALEGQVEAVNLADLLPKRWAEFIRSSDMDDVRPLGTRRTVTPTLPFASPI